MKLNSKTTKQLQGLLFLPLLLPNLPDATPLRMTFIVIREPESF